MNEQQGHDKRVEQAEHEVDEALEAPSTEDFIKNSEPYKQHKKSQTLKFIAGVFVLIAVITGVYFTFLKSDDNQTPEQQPQAQVVDVPKTYITEEKEQYTSQQFFLSFEHPADWDVSDTSRSGLLTATSPIIDIPTDTDQTVSGQVQLQIKAKTQKLSEFDDGNALAVLESEKIVYSQPSSVQRGETYISFLSYAGSASTSLIDGIYVTGDFGYQKDQAVPKVDISKIDPNISIKFFSCDGTCETPLAITEQSLQEETFGPRLIEILKSFNIK